jgi:hypothetical protein
MSPAKFVGRRFQMPDERKESIAQGIASPPESEIGRTAAARNRESMARDDSPRPDGAMGGTSDIDSPADDAEFGRAINERTDRRERPR